MFQTNAKSYTFSPDVEH